MGRGGKGWEGEREGEAPLVRGMLGCRLSLVIVIFVAVATAVAVVLPKGDHPAKGDQFFHFLCVNYAHRKMGGVGHSDMLPGCGSEP